MTGFLRLRVGRPCQTDSRAGVHTMTAQIHDLNEHRRSRLVGALVEKLLDVGYTSQDVAGFTEIDWQLVASVTDSDLPGDRDRRLVVDTMLVFEGVGVHYPQVWVVEWLDVEFGNRWTTQVTEDQLDDLLEQDDDLIAVWDYWKLDAGVAS